MSIEDFEALVKSMFERADKDSNGELTKREFKQFTLFVLDTLKGIPFASNA